MASNPILDRSYPFLRAGAVLGGPVGVMAAGTVAKALGVEKIANSPEGISEAIASATRADPNALMKVKQAEQEFGSQMSKLGFDSAEKLAELAPPVAAAAQPRLAKDKVSGILAIAITVGFFALVAILAFHEIPEGSTALIDTLLGALATAWIGIIHYFFGSSAGSAAKNQLLSDQLTKGK